MAEISYGYERVLEGVEFETAVEHVTAALKEEGFGVLTEIDVKETFKKKLDVDYAEYRILGACNPALAHRALGCEPMLGLLLPCNVVVAAQEGGAVKVAAIKPSAMFQVVENPQLETVAADVDTKIRAVIAAL